MPVMRAASSRCEQRIELAGALERIEIVAAADMGRADENLRHRGAAVGAFDHLRCATPGRRDTSISVNATLFFFRSALASMQ